MSGINLPSTIKCPHYNVGYCKHKNDCKYLHPCDECDEKCTDRKCPKRHRRKCMNTNSCFYNSEGNCEFVHVSSEFEHTLNNSNILKI